MKKLLILLSLATVAWAKPSVIARCPSTGAGFDVDFSQKYKKVKQDAGAAYGWESSTMPLQSQFVLLTDHKDAAHLKAHLTKHMPSGCRITAERPFHRGKLKGLELEGLNESGMPFVVRLFSTPAHGFVYGSFTYDLAQNRHFVDSFRIVPK